MEVTYSNKKNGGAFKQNNIYELTQIAKDNICFSNNDKLNGAVSLYGTTWTMGAMFAESTGLPLKSSIQNNMDKQGGFFPDIISIGDILKAEGYNNELLIGSDAVFGGRKSFYETHGDYTIFDYKYAQQNGYIPEDYYVFWGYEDQKLFEYAKEELLRLSKEEEPFNLTMLTVDTHFEDGYVCDLCDDQYGDDQYANVIRCSSKQVKDFIEWIQQQDFYSNTTIVLSGDHPTMDSDFCNDVKNDYQRKVYTAYINPTVEETKKEYREYSTFDDFPTVLASLGAEIQGDRLGLGINLFSEEQTLVEKYGYETCMKELARKSSFYNSLEEIVLTDDMIKALQEESKIVVHSDEKHYYVDVKLSFPVQSMEGCNGLSMRYWGGDIKSSAYNEENIRMANMQETACSFVVPRSKVKDDRFNVEIYLKTTDKKRINIASIYNIVESTDMEQFIKRIQNKDYSVFMSVRDEAATDLSKNVMKELNKMGVKINLKRDGFRKSYYAVIIDDKVFEDIGDEKLTIEGEEEKYHLKYKVESAGYEAGDYSSIIINDKDYSMNKRGINIVVYNNVEERVEMSVNFDTYLDSVCTTMPIE